MKILEEAGNKGVLQVRALETMKKTKAKNPPKAGQPRKTGITVPKTVMGQPVAPGVGHQSHAEIAVHLRKIQADVEAKFKFKCPLQECGQRCVSESGLKIHWRSKHKGVPYPETVAQVQMPLPATACAGVASSCAGQDQINTAATAGTAGTASPPLPSSVIKRVKVYDDSEYETCSVCPNSRYLKHNRGVHVTSGKHLANVLQNAKAAIVKM